MYNTININQSYIKKVGRKKPTTLNLLPISVQDTHNLSNFPAYV